ncbi:MAG: hypothetical protein HC902_01605 [Calothrix sp. SM1_5_4]|nr:hypothetical protein [Calothrix sp. SM1_5_4]
MKGYRGEALLQSNRSVAHFAFGKKLGEWLLPYPNGADYPAVVVGDTATAKEMNQLISKIRDKVGVEYES